MGGYTTLNKLIRTHVKWASFRAGSQASRAWLLGSALVAAIGGCSTGMSGSPDTILAQVNGEPVTVELLEEAFSASHQGHTALLAGPGVVRELLQKVIDKQLLLQEARRIDLDHDPEIEHVVEGLRAKRASEQFYRAKIAGDRAISQEAIAEAHKRTGDRIQARQILVESRAAAEKALDRITTGADFAAVAIEISQADTAAKGGYLGIVRWGQLGPEVEENLWSLQPGELGKPFETKDGWNLLSVSERQSGTLPPLEKVTPQIRATLEKRESSRRAEILFQALSSRWRPRIDEAALRALLNARDPKQLSSNAALAAIGDDRVTVAQMLPRLDLDRLHKLAEPIALRALKNLLEEDIFRILIRKQALAEGYGEKPEIAKEVETVRNDLAVDRLLDRVAFAKIDAGDDDAQTYWRGHEIKFTEPEAVKLSLMLVESESEAQQALKDIQAGADFAGYARKMSKHRPTAELGGQIGWVERGRLQPELEKPAFSLPAGKFGAAKVEGGIMVIWVEARKAARLKPFGEVKEEAKQLVIREKAQATLKLWITKLREAAVIEIDDQAVERAVTAYEKRVRQKAAQKQG